MSDLLNNGSNSLLAFQRALTTTSHNIANLNTDGYSRQRVDLEALNPSQTSTGFVGNGVRAVGIERLHDQFAMTQVLQSTSAHAQHDTHHLLASRIDNLVADDALSLTPVLNDFFNAIQDVNGNPTSSAAREVFVGSTDAVASRLRALQLQLDNTQEEVNQRTSASVDEVNLLALDVAELNQRIVSGGTKNRGTQANDLLDQRDLLISKLSEHVDINRLEQDDGSVNVFMANGVGLVIGNRASELRTTANSLSSDRTQIEISHGNGWQNITPRLSGGTIGGLLEFDSQTLNPAMNRLGAIALQFANGMNTQHAQGVDLNGNPGSDIFSVNEPNVSANAKNSGSGTLSSSFTDISLVQATEYNVRYTGSDFTITRLSDQTQTSSSLPLTLDGMQINFSGAPAAGDTFRISPTRRAAASTQSMLNGADSIALSSPLRSSGEIGNLSDASVSSPIVDDINNPALRDNIDIRFSSNTSFDIVDSTSGAVLSAGVSYTPGVEIIYNGWQVGINGSPQTGDVFSVASNNSAQGNNANGLAMAAMQTEPGINSQSTYNEEYSALVSRVGEQTRTLQTRSEALDTMRLDAIDRQQAVSGVNLDEEAVNLTRYEQAYQASAQIISTADTLFQTLLGVVRR